MVGGTATVNGNQRMPMMSWSANPMQAQREDAMDGHLGIVGWGIIYCAAFYTSYLHSALFHGKLSLPSFG